MKREIQLLIVDDDEDMLEIERLILVDYGFAARTVGSVEDAMVAIDRKIPDIVLLDLVFPGNPEYGREAARIIRAEYKSMPIFLVTSLNRSYLSPAMDDANYNELIQKPVDFEHLAELIRGYVS